jgi:hypothetical protein
MRTEKTRRTRPSMVAMTAKVTAVAVAAAIALTGGLAIQMAAGHDPALAAKAKHRAPTASSSGGQASGAQTNTAPAQVVTRTS